MAYLRGETVTKQTWEVQCRGCGYKVAEITTPVRGDPARVCADLCRSCTYRERMSRCGGCGSTEEPFYRSGGNYDGDAPLCYTCRLKEITEDLQELVGHLPTAVIAAALQASLGSADVVTAHAARWREVLAEHSIMWHSGTGANPSCTCGWEVFSHQRWIEHIAAIVNAP